MKVPAHPRWISRLFTGGCIALYLLFTLAFPAMAKAEEITYTGFLISDGKLGSWEFHNAQVYLTYVGDTRNVQTMRFHVSSNPADGDAEIEMNARGIASVTIVTPGKTEHAVFAPGQIFVSLDHGTIPVSTPLQCSSFGGGRGIGFGSFHASSPDGVEPTYPFGIDDGAIDWGDYAGDDCGTPGYVRPGLAALPVNLKDSTAFSGHGWSCIALLDVRNRCPYPPTYALETNKGDFYLFQNYASLDPVIPANGGLFISRRGETTDRETIPLPPHSEADGDENAITYTATLITDVTLGTRNFHRAQVYLSLRSDSGSVVPFTDSASGFMNSTGRASVTIVDGEDMVEAEFDPGQLYVYFDKTNGNAGFGSVASGRGYPFALTSTWDSYGLVDNSLIGAVWDILVAPAHATNYSPATAKLVVDLTKPTLLAGGVSSCVSLDPLTSVCSDLTPAALRTDKGDLYVHEPYVVDYATDGSHPFSVNWGIFWAEKPEKPAREE